MLNFKKGTALASLAMMAAFGAAQNVSVTVDGNPVRFRGAPPTSMNGRVLVPLRGVFEELGARVDYSPTTRTIMAMRDGREVTLRLGERTAIVDGRAVALDVPPMVRYGTTLVPIRFVSEALGASVMWNNADQMVMISTDGSRAQRIDDTGRMNQDRDRNRDLDERPLREDRVEVIEENTIIPVRLDTRLSSNESREGDRFTATVTTGNDRFYGVIPAGTRVEGRVVSARPRSGNEPGILELDFQRMRLPNGRSVPIDGTLASLTGENIVRDENGVLRSRTDTKDNRTVYAGYGAGAGLIVGLLTKKPLEGTILGGILGYIAGQTEANRNRPNDVRLQPGSEFGIQLTRELAINTRDIR